MSAPTWVPLGDAPAFGRRATTVRRLRFVVAAALVGLVVVALVAALRLRPTETSLLPSSSSGIVVLDLSASISSDTYARISATLDRLIRSDGAYGLIVFSDTAYQALPPGTPARELRPLGRFFDLAPRTEPGALPDIPQSPWTSSFSGGTVISTGLELALRVIREERLERPAVLLVSDLDDDTGDLDRVSRVAIAYRRAGIPLHVVGLNPSPEDVAFIRRLIPENGSFTRAVLPGARERDVSGRVDVALTASIMLIALSLGALLVLTHRLRWRTAA